DLVARPRLVLGQDPQIEPGPTVSDQQSRHPGLVHPQAHPVTGHPRLGDLEQRTADAVPVADAHLLVGQPFDGEVLAELAVLEVVAPERFCCFRSVAVARRSAFYRRAKVKWATPLGVVTDSTVKRFSRLSRPSQRRTPRPRTIGTRTTCRWSIRSAARNWRTVLGPPPMRTSRPPAASRALASASAGLASTKWKVLPPA